MSFQPKQQDSQKSDQNCSLSENVIKCDLIQVKATRCHEAEAGCLFLNSLTPTLTKAGTQSLSQNHTCVSGVDVTFGKISGWWNFIGLLTHFGA